MNLRHSLSPDSSGKTREQPGRAAAATVEANAAKPRFWRPRANALCGLKPPKEVPAINQSSLRCLARHAGLITLLLAGLATMARAQADRLDRYATGWGYQDNATAADIDSATSSGYRLIDLEVRSSVPIRFDAVYVTRPGSFFYYYDLTSADEIISLATQHGARPVDIERYLVLGSPRWSAVMDVSASGYILWSDQTLSSLANWVAANPDWRMIDIERSEEEDRFHALFYPNEGADARPWWWLVGVTGQEMLAFADANNARVFDVERNGSDSYDALMVGDSGSTAWYVFAEQDSGTLNELAEGLGARIVDLDYYSPTGTSTVVLLENGLFFQDGFESGDLTSWGQH